MYIYIYIYIYISQIDYSTIDSLCPGSGREKGSAVRRSNIMYTYIHMYICIYVYMYINIHNIYIYIYIYIYMSVRVAWTCRARTGSFRHGGFYFACGMNLHIVSFYFR